MPAHYSSIVHANIPIFTCQPDPTRSSNLFRIIKSELWVDNDSDVLDTTMNPIPLELHMYFRDITEIPDDNSLISVQGLFFLGLKTFILKIY